MKRAQATKETETLRPGVYRLTRDVLNPAADRRYRNDWRRVHKWKSGMRFRITEVEEWYGEEVGTLTRLMIDDGTSRYQPKRVKNEHIAGLLAALEPVEATLKDVLVSGGYNSIPETLLDRLILMGKISMDDIREAMRLENEAYEANNG